MSSNPADKEFWVTDRALAAFWVYVEDRWPRGSRSQGEPEEWTIRKVQFGFARWWFLRAGGKFDAIGG